MKRLERFHIYTFLIIVAGLSCLVFSFNKITDCNTFFSVVFFCILAVLTESLSIFINESTYISIGFAIGLAVLLNFHPLIASLIMFTGSFFCIHKQNGKNYHIFNSSLYLIYQRVFNGCAYVLSYLFAGYSYSFGAFLLPNSLIGNFNIIGIIFAIFGYVIINTFIYMILFSLIHKKSLEELLISNIWVIKNLVGIAPIGILMAIAYASYGWFGLVLFIAPLLLARYSFTLYLNMKNVYFETIKALSNTIDAKDQYTNGHSHRVAHYSEVLAKNMGLSNDKVEEIKTAAILHDVGKIGISDSILNKPSSLSDQEFELFKNHPLIGAKIVSEVDSLRDIARIIKYHHEKYDGTGYPEGLKEEEIPIDVAILTLADSLDAMTSDRPYREAMSLEEAIASIEEESGKHFHPLVVKAFQDIMSQNKESFVNVR